jgi:sensor domain CHASE-containing protein
LKSLKLKVVMILFGIFALSLALNHGIHKFIIYPSFMDLEREEAQKDIERIVRAIKREVHHLDTICWDWSSWDDTYDFIKSHSKEYIESNLVIDTFTASHLNIIYFIDKEGKVVWGKIYDLEAQKTMRLADFAKDQFPKTHPLISHKMNKGSLSEAGIYGVFMTEQGPMLISSRPILTSNDKGPARGSLIMGRFLNKETVESLADQTEVAFKLLPVKDKSLLESRYQIEEKSDDSLIVSTTYLDFKGNPAFIIKATIPRSIMAKGYSVMRYTLISIWIAGLAILIVMLLLFQQAVLRPIDNLTKHAVSIGETGDLSVRLPIKRRDEIGTLAKEFDRMLAKLEKKNSELAKVNGELAKDITERKRAEEELQRERDKLQEALDNVRTLHGLIPICAHCKKIRDDKGYWNQIESYIRDHSEADFSHSICPECAKNLYPDYYEGDEPNQ